MSRQIAFENGTLSRFFKVTSRFHFISMLLLSIFVIIYSNFSFAQNTTSTTNSNFTASVSKTQVAQGEPFILTITYNGSAQSADIDFSMLEQNFDISGRSFSSSYSWINGVSTENKNWKITLAPPFNAQGKLTIPSFSLNGQQTQPIEITITEAPKIPNQDELAKMEVSITSNTLYPKQTAILEMSLFLDADLVYTSSASINPPSAPGLNIQRITNNDAIRQVIDNKAYYVYKQQYAITGDKAGNYTIEPPQFNGLVIDTNTQGVSRRIPLVTTSEPIEITLKEIPDSYKGTWLPTQDLTFHQTWLDDQGKLLATPNDELTVSVGQPITRMLELEVKSTPPESFPQITFDYPDSVRVYNDKPVYTEEDGYTIMAIKQVIIPNQAGEVILPELRIPWWNSDKEQQQVASVTPLKLTIEAEANTAVAPPAPQNNAPSTPEANITPPTQPEQNNVQTQTPTNSNNQTSPVAEEAATTNSYWIYAIVALVVLCLLLLIIVLWLFRQVSQLKKGTQNSIKTSPHNLSMQDRYEALLSALKINDGAMILKTYQAWKQNNAHISQELKQAIQMEIDQVMASFYGKEKKSYNINELEQLLKQAQQEKSTNNDPSPLAQL